MTDRTHTGSPVRTGLGEGLRWSVAGDWIATRTTLVLVGALGLSALLLGGLALAIIGESPGSNSYALLAEAMLSGRLHVDGCFDHDCADFMGRTYLIFPPAPAILALPFVAAFGVGFAGFVALAALMSAVALFAWWHIFRRLEVETATAVWLVLAMAFATPLYYVTLRGDGIWFLAQVSAFTFSTLALWCVLERRSLWLAGALIGLAFLSRQFAIFLLPFLFALQLRDDEPLVSFRPRHVSAALKLGLPVAAAVGVYLAYNMARFGHPLDTGYAYVYTAVDAGRNFLNFRIEDLGTFSGEYLLFNLIYFFAQGFHVEFSGRYMTEIAGLDALGTSLLAASPFVLLAIFTPINRAVLVGLATVVVMVAPMMFYHSNGFTQYNAQRYVLDWMPVLFFILALAVRPSIRPALAVLVTYGVALNVLTGVVLFLSGA